MNQHYWSSVQSAFLREHYRTGISAKRWVICRGLKWSSAKRHIKVEAQTLMNATTPENSQIMRNSHQCAKVANDAQSGKNAGCSGENLENKITKSGGETKQPRKRGAPFGNSNATKHGGYTKFWRRPIKEWALHKSLNDINDDDGLILIRHKIISILEYRHQLSLYAAKQSCSYATGRLWTGIFGADWAIDREIPKIIKIERQRMKYSLNAAKLELSIARTKLAAAKARHQVTRTKLKIKRLALAIANTKKMEPLIAQPTKGLITSPTKPYTRKFVVPGVLSLAGWQAIAAKRYKPANDPDYAVAAIA